MRYIEVKEFELEKNRGEEFAAKFFEHTLARGHQGLVRIEVGLNTDSLRKDTVILMFTWESKEDQQAFKQSSVYKEAHKDHSPNPYVLKHKTMCYFIHHEEA